MSSVHFPVDNSLLSCEHEEYNAQAGCEADEERSDGDRPNALECAAESFCEGVRWPIEIILSILEVVPGSEHGAHDVLSEAAEEADPIDHVEQGIHQQPL